LLNSTYRIIVFRRKQTYIGNYVIHITVIAEDYLANYIAGISYNVGYEMSTPSFNYHHIKFEWQINRPIEKWTQANEHILY